MDDRSFPGIPPYASRLLRYKARQLTRQHGFRAEERCDLEHDLYADLLERLPKFDVGRARLNTFAARLIERRVAVLIRHRFADMRSPEREECSLNDSLLGSDGRVVERYQTRAEAPTADQRLHDLAHDIAELREHLPTDEHRLVLDALGRGESTNAIARELDVPWPVAAQYVNDIAQSCGDAGLREYL